MSQFRFPIRHLPSVLQDFANEMETIVDHVMNKGDRQSDGCSDTNGQACQSVKYAPALDVYESDSQYDLYLDLPGVKQEQVKVEMQEGRLHVSGSRTMKLDGEGVVTHRNERVAGEFVRTIRLPKQVDVEKIEAVFDDGVLHISLPKQAKAAPQLIEVRSSKPQQA